MDTPTRPRPVRRMPDLRPDATISPVPDPVPKKSYTRREVRRLLPVTERKLHTWERNGLIEPREEYELPDLIALRTLMKLSAARIPPAKIKRALTALRGKMGELSDPLRELRVVSDGKRIRVELGNQHMEPVSGQLLFNFDQRELVRLLSFPGKAPEKAASQKETAERWFQKGLELEQSGAPPQQAIDAYETAARLDPASAGALVNLGTIHFNVRSWKLAEEYYRRALAIDPNYALAHFNIANLFDERGNAVDALRHYNAALALNPAYADAHYNVALLHQGSGKVMEAVRHWKLYLKLDPASDWGAIARRELDKLRKSTVVQGAKFKLSNAIPGE